MLIDGTWVEGAETDDCLLMSGFSRLEGYYRKLCSILCDGLLSKKTARGELFIPMRNLIRLRAQLPDVDDKR